MRYGLAISVALSFLVIGCGSNKAQSQQIRDLQATVAALQRNQPQAVAVSGAASAVGTAAATLASSPRFLALSPTPSAVPIDAHKRLNDAVAVTLISKGFSKGDYTSTNTYRIGFQNKTSKDMIGVKGVATLADLFGDPISVINISYDHPIPAGQTMVWDAETSFNQFLPKDVKVRDTPFERIQFSFVPQTILFADGSKLDADAGS